MKKVRKDILGRFYEYFLDQFADAEGKKGGQFYTPRSIVRVLVEMMLQPYKGRVYDTCCGSVGCCPVRKVVTELKERLMRFNLRTGSNPTTDKLCKMN